MEDPLKQAIEQLDRAIQQREAELDGMKRSRAQLAGQLIDAQAPPTNEWAGLGITEAAVNFLTEVGEPRSTREIADAIRRKGVRTTSRNYTATVYATLANARKKFRRTDDGNWVLKPSK